MLLLLFTVYLGMTFLILAGFWKAFEKAGKPGWGAIIPLYNIYLMVKIAGQPGRQVLLCFVPLLNIFILLRINIIIANKFGKSTGFGVGLTFLGYIFWPILGFGDAVFRDTDNAAAH